MDGPAEQTRRRVHELRARLGGLTILDEGRLGRRLDGLRRGGGSAQHAQQLERVEQALVAAEERVARRRAWLPELTYPEELPVVAAREQLLDALRDSQVVVVAGETGSGKTTQLPKLCLELGRGIRGTIAHTQPRRIAARAVAERISEELGTPLGTTVGYKVRFTDRSDSDSLVRLMTDGVLLAELQGDRLLQRYDTVIVDEAHERSLNVDFLLGYLKTLLPRRPDLKVVITSATIETARFAEHFDDAPVVTVTGRTFPVEVRYRPLAPDVDEVDGVASAVTELVAHGSGDVLVFLSGEREIRDTAEALRKVELHAEVLPLYGRLSAAEQHRVFSPHSGRRVVLATNVAETSLTVPGIRYVVDPGTARISRYSARLKVQRLPIEAISRASADQRAGRCGRVADGVCIRLYAEDDYLDRPAQTDPEVLRTNLAAVILRMKALALGDVEAFPFLDPPDRRGVRDGIDLLRELGALDADEGLTDVGRSLARFPVDPRIGRMVIEAARVGCLDEVLVIAAALSIQDPRERPEDAQAAADQKHARFRVPGSDFMGWLALWRYLQEQQKALSSSAFRRLCRADFLHYLRVREWQDLHSQLRYVARELRLAEAGSKRSDEDLPSESFGADADRVHQALLPGLLSNIGAYDPNRRDFVGVRGGRFALWPGSTLAGAQPRWVMVSELVQTSRLWGRTAARINPEWVERAAAHLVVRSYSEPRWSAKRGAALATERVTLYGLPLVVGRTVHYSRIDPVVSRELLLRHALVDGEWETHHAFVRENQAVVDSVAAVEDRVRRRDLLADEESLLAFYDARVPPDVATTRDFDAWWKKARREQPELLTLRVADVLREPVDLGGFPDGWAVAGAVLPLRYRFAPGEVDDGASLTIPLGLLNRLDEDDLRWHVPGWRHEVVTTLMRALPREQRVALVPVPDTAAAVLANVRPRSEPMLPALSRELRRLTGVQVRPDAWSWPALPPHLRVRVVVVDDETGRMLAAGRDVPALRAHLAKELRAALARAAGDVERHGLTQWPDGDVPRAVGQGAVQGFPALVDRGADVSLLVQPTPEEQHHAHRRGVRRLLLLAVPNRVRAVVADLDSPTKLALAHSPYPAVPALLEDCALAAVEQLLGDDELPFLRADFEADLARVRPDVVSTTVQVVHDAAEVLTVLREVRAALAVASGVAAARDAVADVTQQLADLVGPGFVQSAGARRLRDITRYLRAATRRLERAPHDAARDRALGDEVRQLTSEWEQVGRQPAEVRWLLEELRVSLFAQQLGTAQPVSAARIRRAIAESAG